MSHSHTSSIKDEEKVSSALRILKPFSIKPQRKHTSFGNIGSDPLESLDRKNFDDWLENHKKNLMLGALIDDEDDKEEFYEHYLVNMTNKLQRNLSSKTSHMFNICLIYKINLFCEDVYMYITPKMHTVTVLCGCDIDFHCCAANYL